MTLNIIVRNISPLIEPARARVSPFPEGRDLG